MFVTGLEVDDKANLDKILKSYGISSGCNRVDEQNPFDAPIYYHSRKTNFSKIWQIYSTTSQKPWKSPYEISIRVVPLIYAHLKYHFDHYTTATTLNPFSIVDLPFF